MKFWVYVCLICSTALADMPLWEKVAFSSDIVVGNLTEKMSSPGKRGEREHRAHAIMRLRVGRSLKGDATEAEVINLKVFAFLSDESLRLFSDGDRAIFFLQKERLPSGDVQYNFVNPPDDGIAPSRPDAERKTLEEVEAQAAVLSKHRDWSTRLRLAMPVGMATLGNRVLNVTTRERAVADILDLPDSDVWMLILVMDDRRSFGNNEVFFSKRGLHGYDAASLMRPEQVIDLIGQALDYKTGSMHVNLSSCVTDEKRQFAVNAWRIYLYYRFVKSAEKGDRG
jgi:hypothetical protein